MDLKKLNSKGNFEQS